MNKRRLPPYVRARKNNAPANVVIGAHRNPPYDRFPWFFVCQERGCPERTFRLCVYAGTMPQAQTLLDAFLMDRPRVRSYAISIGECKDVPLTHILNAPNARNYGEQSVCNLA